MFANFFGMNMIEKQINMQLNVLTHRRLIFYLICIKTKTSSVFILNLDIRRVVSGVQKHKDLKSFNKFAT